MSAPKKKLKVKKARPLIQQLPDSGNYEDGNSKFARALASNDYQTRAKGLEALTRWLSRKSDVSQKDMLKIWKSLYYCFWHSDKAPVQEDLAVTLAKVLLELSEEVAYTYFTAFVETMRREWFGIDRHRLDKFLLLVRHFLEHLFRLLRAHHWDVGMVQRYSTYLQRHVLLPSDAYKAAGFSYHLADIFLPELLKEARQAPPAGPSLEALLEPFAEAMCHCTEAATLNRYREAVFSVVVEEVHTPGEGAPLRQLAVQPLAELLFGLGAQAGVVARNRDALYTTSKELEKAARKRAKKEEAADAAAQASGASVPQQGKKKKKKSQQEQQEQQGQAQGGSGTQSAGEEQRQEEEEQQVQEAGPQLTPVSKKRKKPQEAPLSNGTAAHPSTASAAPPSAGDSPPEPSSSKKTPKSTKRTRGAGATPPPACNGTPLGTPLQTPPANHISDPTPLAHHLFAGHTPAHLSQAPAATPDSTTTYPATKPSKRRKDSHVAFQTPPPSTTPPQPLSPTPSPAATPLPLSPVQPDFSTPDPATVGPAGHTPYASFLGPDAGGPAGSTPAAPLTTGPPGSTPAAIPTTRSKKKAKALLFSTPTPSPTPSTPLWAQQTPASLEAALLPTHTSDFQFHTPASETPDTPTLLKRRGPAPAALGTPSLKTTGKRKAGTPAGAEARTPKQNGGMKARTSSILAKSAGPSTKKKVVINLRRNQEFAHGSPAPQGTPIPQPKGILKHDAVPSSAPPKSTASRTANGTAKPFLTPNKKHYPKAAAFFQS